MPLPDVLFIKGWVSLGTQICWMRAGSAVSVQGEGEWACALQAWPTPIPDQGMMEGKTAIGVTYKYHPAFHKWVLLAFIAVRMRRIQLNK